MFFFSLIFGFPNFSGFFCGRFGSTYEYKRGSYVHGFFYLPLLLKPQKKHTQLLELACCRASTLPQHSTAQRSQPCTEQRSTHAPIRERQQRKQADRIGDSQHVVEHRKSVRSKKTYGHKQPNDARRIRRLNCFQSQYDTTLTLHSRFSFRTYLHPMHACGARG